MDRQLGFGKYRDLIEFGKLSVSCIMDTQTGTILIRGETLILAKTALFWLMLSYVFFFFFSPEGVF